MPPVDEETSDLLYNLFAGAEEAEELKRDALKHLDGAAHVLTDVLISGGGQSLKVRHIVWSLYTCSHLVPLGDFCSGLDTAVARAVAAAVSARLLAGGEAEERLGAILEAAGEFAHRDRMVPRMFERGMGVEYPLPCSSAAHLNALAAAKQKLEDSPLDL
jgi:hypothetical protein